MPLRDTSRRSTSDMRRSTISRRNSAGGRRRSEILDTPPSSGRSTVSSSRNTRTVTSHRRSTVAVRGGGRQRSGGDGHDNKMILMAAGGALLLILIIAIVANSQTPEVKIIKHDNASVPAATRPAASSHAPASSGTSSSRRNKSRNAPPPGWKGPPKLRGAEDDKWEATHTDNRKKLVLTPAEISAKLTEAEKILNRSSTVKNASESTRLRKQVSAICDDVINSNASESEKAKAARFKYNANKFQTVK